MPHESSRKHARKPQGSPNSRRDEPGRERPERSQASGSSASSRQPAAGGRSRKDAPANTAGGKHTEHGKRPERPDSARKNTAGRRDVTAQRDSAGRGAASAGRRDTAGQRASADHHSSADRRSSAGRRDTTGQRDSAGRGAASAGRRPSPGRGDTPSAASRSSQGGNGSKSQGVTGASRGDAKSQNVADAGRGGPKPKGTLGDAGRSGKGASAAERYPQAEFALRSGMLEGFPAAMVVNRALKDYPFRKDFPWCLRLAVAYRADQTTGQPLEKEERVLENFEQSLFGLLKKTINGHYIGHTSWGGTREFLFYLDDGGEAEEPLQAFAQTQKRELEFALSDDPKWQEATHYFDYRD